MNVLTPDPDRLELWLRDLETTTDPQTHNALTDAGGDCCLGRLCKVAIADGVDIAVVRADDTEAVRTDGVDDENYPLGMLLYDGRVADPPRAVSRWLFGDDYKPAVVDRFNSSCIEWNDDYRLSFVQIAGNLRAAYDAETGDPLVLPS